MKTQLAFLVRSKIEVALDSTRPQQHGPKSHTLWSFPGGSIWPYSPKGTGPIWPGNPKAQASWGNIAEYLGNIGGILVEYSRILGGYWGNIWEYWGNIQEFPGTPGAPRESSGPPGIPGGILGNIGLLPLVPQCSPGTPESPWSPRVLLEPQSPPGGSQGLPGAPMDPGGAQEDPGAEYGDVGTDYWRFRGRLRTRVQSATIQLQSIAVGSQCQNGSQPSHLQQLHLKKLPRVKLHTKPYRLIS